MMDSTKTRVIAEEEGKLRVSNLLLGSREFVEIEPAVFQEVGEMNVAICTNEMEKDMC